MSARPRLIHAAVQLTIVLAACGLLALAPTAHATKKNKKATHTTQAVTKKHKHVTRVKPSQNHSGETRAERDKRLSRECRGMPNAGACLGYARP